MAIRFSAHLSGLFFLNPVGQLHRNIYKVLIEASEAGAGAMAAQLTQGSGLRTGAMRDSIEPRLVKANRFNRFQGRARVIVGARDSWAPTPSAGTSPPWTYASARNRAAAKKFAQKRRFQFRAAALTQAWISSNRGLIERILAWRLS